MKVKKIIASLLFFVLAILFTNNSFAQSNNFVPPEQNYYKAEVTRVIKSGTREIQNYKNFFQFVEVRFLEGPNTGKTKTIENSGSIKLANEKELETGDKVIVLEVIQNQESTYSIWDKYRLNYIYFLVIGFFTLIIIFSGLKGIGSILGMAISFLILIGFIVPYILKGYDAVLITIIGSMVILFSTIFLAHGISKRTGSAVISTTLALAITGILAFVSVKMLNLTGFGDETNTLLQIGNFNINAQGLLLGGIIIGTLGVLDDVTTTQSAAIFEMFKIDKKLSFTDLFTKGYVVGREHIASLVNTLILAYAGASLGLFVFFVLNPNNTPIWVMVNNEMVAEEIVRAIVGSTGLILAVPITTIIASYFAKKSKS
jgi:uncharacterized membrane protein